MASVGQRKGVAQRVLFPDVLGRNAGRGESSDVVASDIRADADRGDAGERGDHVGDAVPAVSVPKFVDLAGREDVRIAEDALALKAGLIETELRATGVDRAGFSRAGGPAAEEIVFRIEAVIDADVVLLRGGKDAGQVVRLADVGDAVFRSGRCVG